MSTATTHHRPASTAAAPWLTACRSAVTGLERMLARHTTIADRAQETGTLGEGGDHTLRIDAEAEQIVFDELARLHAAGHRFLAVSEERGAIGFGCGTEAGGGSEAGGKSGSGSGGSGGESGSGGSEVVGAPADCTDPAADHCLRVVIDPIDGSLNAKRGLAYHALSVAVASGPTMKDVFFGYVYVLGTGDEFWAELGDGAFLNDHRLDATLGERRGRGGRLEVLGLESTDPRRLRPIIDQLVDVAARLRSHGSLATSLCEVAAGRFDALISLRPCRAVDVAAAQLIVREGGGLIGFPGFDPPLAAPLDLLPHAPVLAARAPATLAQLESIG